MPLVKMDLPNFTMSMYYEFFDKISVKYEKELMSSFGAHNLSTW